MNTKLTLLYLISIQQQYQATSSLTNGLQAGERQWDKDGIYLLLAVTNDRCTLSHYLTCVLCLVLYISYSYEVLRTNFAVVLLCKKNMT